MAKRTEEIFIVDDENELKGSVTDWDIRRWILKGEEEGRASL